MYNTHSRRRVRAGSFLQMQVLLLFVRVFLRMRGDISTTYVGITAGVCMYYDSRSSKTKNQTKTTRLATISPVWTDCYSTTVYSTAPTKKRALIRKHENMLTSMRTKKNRTTRLTLKILPYFRRRNWLKDKNCQFSPSQGMCFHLNPVKTSRFLLPETEHTIKIAK